MYVISDSDGVSYWEEISVVTKLTTVTNVVSYPAAGDLADISDGIWGMRLTAEDSVGNIQAGQHFGFDLTIHQDAEPGNRKYFHISNSPIPDDTIILNVVPEPSTILLLSFGGLALLKKHKAR